MQAKSELILYLLPFKSGEEFKFGTSKSKDNHFKTIDRLYGVDFTKAKILTALDNGLIFSIEQQLKHEYRDFACKHHRGKDGWTEILPIKFLALVIEEITEKAKKEWLKLRLEDFQFTCPIEKIAAPKKQKRYPVSLEYVGYEEHLDAKNVFYLKHRYGRKLIEEASMGKREVVLDENEFPGALDFAKQINKMSLEVCFLQVNKLSKWESIKRKPKSVEYINSYCREIDRPNTPIINLSEEFVADAMCGHLEELLAQSEPSSLEMACYRSEIKTKEEARQKIRYLIETEEEFDEICNHFMYLPEKKNPPDLKELYYAIHPYFRPREPKLNIANEKEWREFWIESGYSEKNTLEEFLKLGGYQLKNGNWIKYY